MAGFGLRARLVLLAVGAALPALLAVLYSTVSEYQRATRDAEAQVLRFVDLIGRRQQVMVDETWSVLGLLSRNAGLRPDNPDRCNGLLREMYESGVINPATLSVVSVADATGEVYCSTRPITRPVNLADHAFFRRVMESRQLTLGRTLVDHVSDQPVVPAAYPVLDAGGAVAAVLVAGLNLPELARALPELPKGAVVTLLNERGLVLGRTPDPEGWVGKTLADEPLIAVLGNWGQAPVAQLTGLDGVERIYGFQRSEIGDVDIFAVVGFATEQVYSAARSTLIGGLVAVLGAGIAAVLFGRFLGYELVSRSVRALTDAAGPAMRGEPAPPVAASAVGGEVSEMASGFDSSAAQARHTPALHDGEERYREVIDIIPAAVWIHADGHVVFANQYATRMLGGSRPVDLIGREILSLIHPDDRPRVIERFRRIAEGQGSLPLAEFRFIRLDGRTVVVEVQAIRYVRDGKVHVLAAGRDVTAQRAAEEQLRQAQKLESIGRLTGGVAHDFNNLLTVIVGHLDIALDSAPGPLRASIEGALNAAEKAAALTQRLLAFSRQQPLAPEPIDVNDLVAGMEDMLRRTVSEDIEITLQLQPDLWPALADKSQLESALLNLVVNARDAMPEGGKLTIETANVHLDESYAETNAEVSPGDYTLLAVSDTGTGMAQEIAERAVEPFFTTKSTGKGTGLGLSMVYGFAKQSRGHLKIYSEVGLGTTVRLYLPRANAAEAALPEGTTPVGSTPGSGETVLLVEDDAAVRALVARQLTDLGYRVIEAADGAAAQNILESEVEIDLLFTDVVMPGGVTGRKLAEQAKARRPGLRILFTSGYTENSILHHGRLDAGVQLLSKPYKKHDLARKLREVLDGPSEAA